MAKKKTTAKSKEAAPDFEASLGELEQIVGQLEAGNLPLAEAIERYEQGVKLLKQCHGSLNAVQRKIELLTQVNEQGEEQTIPFDDHSSSDEATGDGDSGRLF